MTPKSRIDSYIEFGFSAERLSEIFDWPVEELRERKRAKKGPSLDAAVIMVLGGKSQEAAAVATGVSLADVRCAVAKARFDIECMAKASR